MIANTNDPQREARERLSEYIQQKVRASMGDRPRSGAVAALARKMSERLPQANTTLGGFISDVRTGSANYAMGFDRESSDELRREKLNCLAVLFEALGFPEEDDLILRTQQVYGPAFVYPPTRTE